MSNFVLNLILGIVSVCFFSVWLLALPYYFYKRVRNKGFRAPGALGLVAAFWMVGLAFSIAGLFLASSDLLPLLMLFVPLSITAALILLLRALPDRNARVFGERRIRVPFTFLGMLTWVATIAAVGGVLYGWWIGSVRPSVLVQAFSTLLVCGALVGSYMIRQSAVKSMRQLPTHDGPIGALYLRPFSQESKYFVYGSKEKYGAYATSFSASITPIGYKIGVRFDEYFSSVITSAVGEFVALGNPEDYIPSEGIHRIYASDSEWKDRFDNFARRASLILVELGSSDNLNWEFDYLRREGLQQKLFIITPPTREGSRVNWWVIDFARYITGIRPVIWAQFSKKLALMGYDLDPTNPGPGAVVTFDRNGKSMLLITNAKTPEDFVEAMLAWSTQVERVVNIPTCTLHILDDKRNQVRETRCAIGKHVNQEIYDRHRDAEGHLYGLVYYEGEKPLMRIMPKGEWLSAMAKRGFRLK